MNGSRKILWSYRSSLESAVHVQGGTILVKAGTEVGVMAVEIAQSTRVVCAQGFEFRDRVGDSDVDFGDVRVGKRLVDQDLEVWQFRTQMGGVTDDIAQSALDSRLWRSRRGRGCRGGLVLVGCPLTSFAFLSGD